MDWQPMEQATEITMPKWAKLAIKVMPSLGGEVWRNDQYVVVKRNVGQSDDPGAVIHLSIRRVDREAVRDWRDFQRIKNELCGTEAEGIEIYPAESRVVDTANQYHLWVFTRNQVPVGFKKGLRLGEKVSELFGAKQRDR